MEILLLFAYLYKGEKEKEKEERKKQINNPLARYIDWLSTMIFVYRIKTSDVRHHIKSTKYGRLRQMMERI